MVLCGDIILHDSDSLFLFIFQLCEKYYTLSGLFLDYLGKADRSIHLSFDFHHCYSPKVGHKKAACLIQGKRPESIWYSPGGLWDHILILLCLIWARGKTVQIIKAGLEFHVLFPWQSEPNCDHVFFLSGLLPCFSDVTITRCVPVVKKPVV